MTSWYEDFDESVKELERMTYEAHLVHINRLDNQSFFDHVERLTGGSIQQSVQKEIEMASAQATNGQVFNVGDRVKIGNGTAKYNVGTIESIHVQVKLSPSSFQGASIDNISHYQGPASVEDAWERVTMDIAARVSEIVGTNGYKTILSDSDRRTIRADAYKVLGCVINCNENHAALSDKLTNMINRAEQRFTSPNH